MPLRLFPRRGSVARRRLVAGLALALALVALFVDPRGAREVQRRAAAAEAPSTTIRRATVAAPRPAPKAVTLVTDSVTLGAAGALRAALPGWHVEVLGKPALMVDQAVPRYLPAGRKVAPIVVVGLGYNSLWQPNRVRYDVWAAQFDREADALVAQLRSRGARRIVWVTLRQPSPSVVTADGLYQYAHYAWFFPYVNERLRVLAHDQPDVSLADWAAVSDRAGLTYDLIHLNPAGARLMAHVIVGAIDS